MIAIVDYGVGNLFSGLSSVRKPGRRGLRDPRCRRFAGGGVTFCCPASGRLPTLSRSSRPLGLGACSARKKRRKSRCWASAWVCSCCLKKAMNTASTRASALSPAQSALADDLAAPNLKVPQHRLERAGHRTRSGKRPAFVHQKRRVRLLRTQLLRQKLRCIRRLPPASTASRSQARCGEGWCTAPSSTRKNPATPACGC